MNEMYVVIKSGYEGIEGLVYATNSGEEASQKVKSIRNEIKQAVERKEKFLKEFGEEEDELGDNKWDKLYFEKKITYEEHQNSKFRDPDAYCVQKWDGVKFGCDCKKLGCEPSKQWFM